MRVRTIVTNTGFNLIAMVVNSLIAMVITPYLIVQLGEALFGVWALAAIIIVVAQMSDFGLGRALVRNVAQHRSLGRWSAISLDFNSDLWPLALVILFVSALAWALAPLLAAALGVPESLMTEAVPVLRLLCLTFLPVAAGLLLAATLEGAQQMGYTSAALILNRLIFVGGVVWAMRMGWGLQGVAAAQLAAVVAQTLFLALAAFRITPTLRVSPGLIAPQRLRHDLRFGRYIFLTGLVSLIFTASNKIILAHWVGLESVAFYELASVVALQLFAIALAAAQALYPAYATAHVQGGWPAVQRLYRGALRVFTLTIAPLGAVIIALAAPLVMAWFGRFEAEPVQAMRWLVAGWLVVSMAASASVGLQAIGRPGLAALFSIYNAALNLALALLLVPRWGFQGVLAANVLAITSSALFTLWAFRRLSGLSVREWWRGLSPDVLFWVGGLALGLGWLATRLTDPSLLQIVALVALYACGYVAGLVALRLLRPEESAWLREFWDRKALRLGLSS
ncbi:MAG: oligosaccharide flippase family protein [Chloroflexi bacterium]|nr:oligosaccharide flippase family protein [Chloroflexota bacterium]